MLYIHIANKAISQPASLYKPAGVCCQMNLPYHPQAGTFHFRQRDRFDAYRVLTEQAHWVVGGADLLG